MNAIINISSQTNPTKNKMYQTGTANLPLHGGKAPTWLTGRMQNLAREITNIIIEEYGTTKFLARLSNPYWFQALCCTLAYDWHSSGVTTVVTGVLKTALSPEHHDIAVCGGKGKTSRKTPNDITYITKKWNFPQQTIDNLLYTSRIIAKVDNNTIQAGYQLYHHAFLITKQGQWAVIQQGMNNQNNTARRYHWHSENTKTFIEEPHSGIVCNIKHDKALNMIAKESQASRKASVDLAKEPPNKLIKLLQATNKPKNQTSLQRWMPKTDDPWLQTQTTLNMPRNINWETLSRLYEFQPQNYEELLSIKGVGPTTVRGLALVAELIYGEEPSWEDPVKFSFAYGGKDGVPFPVERKAMDESIEILKKAIEEAKIGEKEKLRSLQNLRQFIPKP
ncbi:MAG: DUF763 domain-containing protein [Nitrososphaerota archaeon]|jgi:hypothetical protein|nr:DUF763 domain-containing protein [Nitrososphaerota archaeon]